MIAVLSPAEVADLLGKTPATVRGWCRAKKIAATLTPGGEWLIARSALVAMLPAEAIPRVTPKERKRQAKEDYAEILKLA